MTGTDEFAGRRAAWSGLRRALRIIAERGSFEGSEGLTFFDELNEVVREDRGD